MRTESRTKRATVGAALIFAVVAAFTMVAGSAPASAQAPSHLDAGVITIGSITVEYTGSSVLVDAGHLDADGWVITGGSEPVPAADVLADVTDLTTSHIVIENVEVLLLDTGGCTVTFGGPLLVDASGGVYHAYFDKGDLGGISYSGCDPFLEGLILFTIAMDGVLVEFDLS